MASRWLLNISRGLVIAAVCLAPFLLTSLPGVDYNVFYSIAPTLARYPATIMIADLLIIAAAACYLAAMGLSGALGARLDLLDWGPLAFVVAAGVASLTSVYKFASVLEVRRLADCVAVFLLARVLFRDEAGRARALWAFLLSAAVTAGYGVRNYLFTAVVHGQPTWREFGTFGNPNSFAGLLIMAAPVAVALCVIYLARVRRGQALIPFVVAAIATVLALTALFLTGSKGGFLALALAAVAGVLLLGWGAQQLRLRAKLAGLGLVALVMGIPLLLPPIRVRILAAFTTQSHSGGFRWYTWKGVWRMIEAHPILGTGPGTFVHAYQKYALVGFTRMAHNKDLQVWAECGIFALLALAFALTAYLVVVALRVRLIERLRDRAYPVAMWTAVVAFCLHNLVDWDWYVPALCLTAWFLMGLSVPRPGALPDVDAEELASNDARASKRRKGRKRSRPSADPSAPPDARVRAAYWVAIGVALIYVFALPLRTLAAARACARAATTTHHALAAQYLRRASRLSPLDAEPRFRLGRTLEALWRATGDSAYLNAAIEQMRRAHALQRSEPRNLYWLAQLYAARSDRARAAAAARAAHEAAPNDTRSLVLYAQLAEAAGLSREAEDAWWELRQLWDDPGRPVRRYSAVPDALPDFRYAYAWLHFARAELASGNRDEAGRLVAAARDVLQDYQRRAERRRRMLEAIGKWPPEGLSEARTLMEEAELLSRTLAGAGR